jgi:hypothetical protein
MKRWFSLVMVLLMAAPLAWAQPGKYQYTEL